MRKNNVITCYSNRVGPTFLLIWKLRCTVCIGRNLLGIEIDFVLKEMNFSIKETFIENYRDHLWPKNKKNRYLDTK
jgi:hypothetical protein